MSSHTRGQGISTVHNNLHLANMARKKDERAVRAAHRREQQMHKMALNGDPFASFAVQLAKMGLEIRDIPGDGNCLFRALGDQIEGHGRNHLKHRHDVVEFMRKHRDDFEPFVEDDVPFDRHIAMLAKPGTYAGNDCIVAFARIHRLTVLIHQLGSPLWQVHGSEKKDGKQVHISYHNGDHYASIRKIGDKSESPANIRLGDPSPSKPMNTKKSPSTPPQQSSASTWCDNYDSYDVSAYSDYNDGVARVYRDIPDLEATVMASTGCLDQELVSQALLDCSYDVDACISYILHISAHSSPTNGASALNNGIWAGNGTATRIFGQQSPTEPVMNGTGTKPKQTSTTQRKREKKLERKARAAEQRRLNMNKRNSSSSEEDVNTVLPQSMATLKI